MVAKCNVNVGDFHRFVQRALKSEVVRRKEHGLWMNLATTYIKIDLQGLSREGENEDLFKPFVAMKMQRMLVEALNDFPRFSL